MKNFIFAMCGFLMMSLVSLSVQASSVETAPADCVVLTMTHPMFLVANNPAMMCSIKEGMAIQGVRINVPKCPFRYIYKSKHCTHYSYTAYSKLITPY